MYMYVCYIHITYTIISSKLKDCIHNTKYKFMHTSTV